MLRPLLAWAWLLALALPASAAPKAPKIWHEPQTGMAFVALPKGCFQMGTPPKAIQQVDESLKAVSATLASDETPQHEVCVDAFWIGQTEVRASDWAKVMGEPAPFGLDNAPAGGIRFEAAQEFARRLTQLSTGPNRFRLPTEAEWEYACRGGTRKEKMPFIADQIDIAWYSVELQRTSQPSPVGQLKPNAWGLYDMLGNVWEWVADAYHPAAYAKHALYNPQHKDAPGGERVIRGASYRSDYIQLRCANRSSYSATETLGQIGLRLVRQP